MSHEQFANALSAGNFQSAGDWLVRRFASEVFGLCQAIVRDRSAAEDLSQEVFAKAFAGLDGYRGDASARTWILAIARNRCIDYLRSQQRWSGLDEDSDPDDHAEEISLPSSILDRRTEIDSALQELDEMERGLIVLRFRHGLAYDELGQAFGIKSGTARMRVSRALAKMRDSLEAPMARVGRSLKKESVSGAGPAPRAAAAPLPAASRPAPGAAPPAPSGAPQAPKKRGGLFRLRRSAPPAPQAPPAPPSMPSMGAGSGDGYAPEAARQERHALSEYFEASGNALSAALHERLSQMASSLPAGH